MVCDSTHALIPEFSLPGTSIGTKEANKYIAFEKKVMSAVQKAMAIFPDKKDTLHNPLLLYQSQVESDKNIILKINYAFLERGYNPLFFSRSNILRIREIKTGIRLPLNKGAIWSGKLKIDSS